MDKYSKKLKNEKIVLKNRIKLLKNERFIHKRLFIFKKLKSYPQLSTREYLYKGFTERFQSERKLPHLCFERQYLADSLTVVFRI